ncbi:MAG: hypothetical protein J6W96_06235 [Alphaproteobacteria bacterium]|nr:hypothetical protein [Alphaproteobacteria bacterium]
MITQPADRYEIARIEYNPRGADYVIHCWNWSGENKYKCQDIIHTTELLLERFKEEYKKVFGEEYKLED